MNKSVMENLRKIVDRSNEVDQCDDEWDHCVEKLAAGLPRSYLFSLKQLVEKGPVEDGDVASKSERDDLIELELATRVMHKGGFGYTAATYLGGFVLKAARKVEKGL